MREKICLGRYDYAAYCAFTVYSICSLAIPIVIVAMGKELNFPLDDGGMSSGGILHLVRSVGMTISLAGCGFLAAKWGKRRSVGWSIFMSGLGVFLCAFSGNFLFLLPVLFIAGIGEGVCEGLATPFVQDLHPDKPERYVSISHAFWSVGIMICMLGAGGLLTLGVSWRIILGIAGIFAMLNSLWFFWKETPGKEYPEVKQKISGSEIWHNLGKIVRNGRFWGYCVTMCIGAGAEFCLTFWAAAFLELEFNATPFIAGLGTTAIALGMFTGRSVFGYFAKAEKIKYVLLCCSFGAVPVSLLLTILKTEYFPSQGLLFATLMLILFICGIGVAPFWPLLQVYGVLNLPQLDSTLLYIFFSAVGVPGCGFFTWLIGVVGDGSSLTAGFLLIPASMIVYGTIILFESWVFPVKNGLPQSSNP